MGNVFLSYARDDTPAASAIAADLVGHGFAVWWDHHLQPGADFAQQLREAVHSAGCVLVVWSRHSVVSDWIRAEAAVGMGNGTLVGARVDVSAVPSPFDTEPIVDLVATDGAITARSLAALQSAVERTVARLPAESAGDGQPLPPPTVVGAPAEADQLPPPAAPAGPATPAAAVVLVERPGLPPLTDHVVVTLAGMYGWVNDIEISSAQLTDLAQRLAADWQGGNQYGVAVAVQGCQLGDQAQAHLAQTPGDVAIVRTTVFDWLLDRQADLHEFGLRDWMTAVAFAQPESSVSAHDAYIGAANTLLSTYVAKNRPQW